MNILKLILATCVVLMIACSCSNKAIVNTSDVEKISFKRVELNEVLSHPEHYNQVNVDIIGYAAFGFEVTGLFLDNQSAAKIRTENGLWLVPDSSMSNGQREFIVEKCNGKKVRVKGLIDSKEQGHLNAYKAQVKIKYLEIL